LVIDLLYRFIAGAEFTIYMLDTEVFNGRIHSTHGNRRVITKRAQISEFIFCAVSYGVTLTGRRIPATPRYTRRIHQFIAGTFRIQNPICIGLVCVSPRFAIPVEYVVFIGAVYIFKPCVTITIPAAVIWVALGIGPSVVGPGTTR
jgi:hypothetical protein